ncbi:lysylphosphatidylglycerol synthase transmembrane domain-containing protein [soil metagenome]
MKRFLSPLRYLIFLGIGALLLWLTFRDQDFGLVLEKIKHANPWWLLLSVVLGILALVSRAMRWRQLMEPLGYKPRLLSTFNAVMFGYMANMAIPRLGEISRCGALNKSEEIPFDKLVGTVIVERIADVIMLLISILMVTILEFDLLGGFLKEHIFGPIMEKIAGSPVLVGIVVIILIAGVATVIGILRMNNPPALVIRIQKLLAGIFQGVKSITKLKNKGLFLFHSVFIWVMYFLVTFVCFPALESTAHLDASAALFVMVIGGIAMTAPVQGGIGVYHLLVSAGLTLYAVSESDGIVFATMVHSTQTLLLIGLGALSMIYLFFFTKPKSSKLNDTSGSTGK